MSLSTASPRGCCAGTYMPAQAPAKARRMRVFGGHDIIAENGIVLAESKLYSTGLTVTEIDVQKLAPSAAATLASWEDRPGMRRIPFDMEIKPAELTRIVRRTPFVPNTSAETDKRCEDILTMQAHGLEKRVRHTNAKTLVIGISGGLDSTLALLVAARSAIDRLGLPRGGHPSPGHNALLRHHTAAPAVQRPAASAEAARRTRLRVVGFHCRKR